MANNIDFEIGSFVTNFIHQKANFTMLQRYYPEAFYRYDSGYSPGKGVLPYTHAIFYIAYGKKNYEWEKIAKTKNYPEGYGEHRHFCNGAMVLSMLNPCIYNENKNAVYIVNFWANNTGLKDLMFESVFGLVDSLSDSNIGSVRFANKNIVRNYTHNNTLDLEKDEAVFNKGYSFKINPISKAIKTKKYYG